MSHQFACRAVLFDLDGVLIDSTVFVERAWRAVGAIILCESDEEMVRVADQYAPEHLEVQTRDPAWFLARLTNYGSLFLGSHATVAYGDKGIGTNHVLPTGRAARYTGGLWVGKFMKTVTYQTVTAQGDRRIAPTIDAIAEAELMKGRAEATTGTQRARTACC